MRLKYVMSTVPKQGDTQWVMAFDTGDSFPISQETAHQLIGALILKNLTPTGDPDIIGNIINQFLPLNKVDTIPQVGKEKTKTCLNCLHWRDKAWVNKGWGICDNLKNEVKIGTAMISAYVSDETMREELRAYIEDGIRYPEDFGCIFFEPK